MIQTYFRYLFLFETIHLQNYIIMKLLINTCKRDEYIVMHKYRLFTSWTTFPDTQIDPSISACKHNHVALCTSVQYVCKQKHVIYFFVGKYILFVNTHTWLSVTNYPVFINRSTWNQIWVTPRNSPTSPKPINIPSRHKYTCNQPRKCC